MFLNDSDQDKLEALLDKNDLKGLLESLALIATEKGNHFIENWQDKDGAEVWYEAADEINACADSESVGDVP